MCLDAADQCSQIARVVVVVVDGAQPGRPAKRLHRAHGCIQRGAGGSCRVLRKQRQCQDAAHAVAHQVGCHRAYRGFTVGHRQRSRDPATRAAGNFRADGLGKLPTENQQGRTVVAPDLRVGFGGAARPCAQDVAVQDRPPQPAGQFDHAWVGQEFGKVLANRVGRGLRGGPQVDQQYRYARGIMPFSGGIEADITGHDPASARLERHSLPQRPGRGTASDPRTRTIPRPPRVHRIQPRTVSMVRLRYTWRWRKAASRIRGCPARFRTRYLWVLTVSGIGCCCW